MKILKCTWCMKPTYNKPCEHCGSGLVYDPKEPHTHDWSRNTIDTVICKICDKIISGEEYFKGAK